MPLLEQNLGYGVRSAGINNFMSPRNNIQKGLCPKCEGFLQQDKINHLVYCVDCPWRIDADDYDDELKDATDDYEFHDSDDALKYLNNYGR